MSDRRLPPNKERQTRISVATAPRRSFGAKVGKPLILVAAALVVAFSVWTIARKTAAQDDLQITYGPSGVQMVSYNGMVLEDLNRVPGDAFHIWHMKSTDLDGKVRTDGQYGWGENNSSKTWDAAKHAWTYNFIWGSIDVQFKQSGSSLDMIVTTTNSPTSGIIFDGATIYPFALNFPKLPNNFADTSYPQLAYNTTGPSVTVADFGDGEVLAVATDAKLPLYSGFWPTGNSYSYYPMMSGTTPDNLAAFQPHQDRPVRPGETATYTVSLRFAPSGTPASKLATDAYKSWAATYPPTLNWSDRRAIGTVYLASSPTGDDSQVGGNSNPRRYFSNSHSKDFDVTTPAGLAVFQAKVLAQAAANVATLKTLHAQGAITWDIEGEQYPQSTSYVCAPDEIARVSPEMESTVSNRASPYAGMKLDDAYFKIMRDAGFRVGICVRPQHFTTNGNGTAQQVYLANDLVADELTRKIRYAHDRWGATLFYIDSTVEQNGAVLDATIFQQVAKQFPDSLLLPEQSTPRYYAYTAPLKSFINLGAVGTDSNVLSYYPKAFSSVLINDVSPGKLSAAENQLAQHVKQGDLLMAHGDYAQANNSTVEQIYRNNGVATGSSSSAPVIRNRVNGVLQAGVSQLPGRAGNPRFGSRDGILSRGTHMVN